MKLSSVVVRALALPLLLVSVFLTPGCGGGTVGTDGGGSTKIVGLISTSDGAPVAGATVQVGTERNTVKTDVTGHFSTEQVVTTPELAIVVTTDETSSQITVADLPLRPEQVEVEIEVRVQDKNVRLRKQVVKPRSTPTAIPSVTETIASTPTIVPTTIPLEPTPTAVVEPTAAPSVTPIQPTPVVPEETPPTANNPSGIDPNRSTIQPILVAVPKGKSSGTRLAVSSIRAVSVGSATYRGWLAGARIITRGSSQTAIRLKLSWYAPSPVRRRLSSTFTLSGTPNTSSSLAAPIYLGAVIAKTGKYYLTSLTPGWTISPALPPKVPVIDPAKPSEDETEYVVRIALPTGFDANRIVSQFLDADVHSTELTRSSDNNVATIRSILFSQRQPSQLRLDIDLQTEDGMVASVTAPLSNARSGRENNHIDARLVETASGFSLSIE